MNALNLESSAPNKTVDQSVQTLDVFVSAFDVASLLQSPLNEPEYYDSPIPMVIKRSVSVAAPCRTDDETYGSRSLGDSDDGMATCVSSDEDVKPIRTSSIGHKPPSIVISKPSDSSSNRSSCSPEKGLARLCNEIDTMLQQYDKPIKEEDTSVDENLNIDDIITQMKCECDALALELDSHTKTEPANRARMQYLQRVLKQFSQREQQMRNEFDDLLKAEREKVTSLKTEKDNMQRQLTDLKRSSEPHSSSQQIACQSVCSTTQTFEQSALSGIDGLQAAIANDDQQYIKKLKSDIHQLDELINTSKNVDARSQPIVEQRHSMLPYVTANVNRRAENDNAKYDHVKEMQKQIDELTKHLDEQTREHQMIYLTMFKKGKEAARHEMESETHGGLAQSHFADDKCMSNLTDDQIVLRFLRDATYYYLTNKDQKSKDSHDHLNTIMTLLHFSVKQKCDVVKRKH